MTQMWKTAAGRGAQLPSGCRAYQAKTSAARGRREWLTTLESDTKSNTMYTQEQLTALRGIMGVLNIFQEEKEIVLLKLGASVPFSILNSSGGLGYANRSLGTQGIKSACPDAEQLDPYYIAQGHAVDCAVEAYRKPPQAVTEGGYLAVETYHAAKVHTAWTDAGTELLVLAYDDPDAVGIIKSHEQRERKDKVQKVVRKFHPMSTAALPRGSGFQSFFRQNNKHVRNYLASNAFERELSENHDGPLIVTYGSRLPPTLRGHTQIHVAEEAPNAGEGGCDTAAAVMADEEGCNGVDDRGWGNASWPWIAQVLMTELPGGAVSMKAELAMSDASVSGDGPAEAVCGSNSAAAAGGRGGWGGR
ncbi:unnamed protein product [Sphacelaria rigidula]